MSRVCDVTGKKPMFGNNVSHAHNKSRRRFNINLQKKKFWLPDENRYITLRISTRGMRVIDKRGKSNYFGSAIEPILNKHDVFFEDISHLPCIEIDFKEDLQKANQLVKNKLYNI